MRKITVVLCLLSIWIVPVFSQGLPPEDENSPAPTFSVKPPPDLRNWTPEKNQKFQLYVNFDRNAGDSLPRIDIFGDGGSWPFALEKLGDTFYVFIVPPGYSLKTRSTINGLEKECPFVVWAGTERAIYWFSYDSAKVLLDTIQPASFISTVPLQQLPGNTLTLQLQGTNKNAKTITSLLAEIGKQATLIQLKDGFYQNTWFRISQSIVRRWKVNETKIGTFLAFQCVEGSLNAVSQILEKYRQEVPYATQ